MITTVYSLSYFEFADRRWTPEGTDRVVWYREAQIPLPKNERVILVENEDGPEEALYLTLLLRIYGKSVTVVAGISIGVDEESEEPLDSDPEHWEYVRLAKMLRTKSLESDVNAVIAAARKGMNARIRCWHALLNDYAAAMFDEVHYRD